MNCKACGYNDHGDPATHYAPGTIFKPFIEMGVLVKLTPDRQHIDPTPGRMVFACPQCGTLKIEVKP